MRFLSRLLHGWRNQRPTTTCCGRGWADLGRHRIFAHGETTVLPALHELPCVECGRPAVGWRFVTLEDGIVGESVCVAHLAGVAA